MKPSHYIHGTDREEQNRLAKLNDLLNAGYIDELNPVIGDKILDIGSGLGQLTRLMAAKTGPGGIVVGVERHEKQIARATELMGECPADIRPEFRIGDALHLPLEKNEWGSFSLVHTRFLLEHIPNPGAVVGEMVKAARPGGRIFLADDDHDVFRLTPEPKGFRSLWNAYIRSYERVGNDPYVGRHLVEILNDCGLVRVRNSSVFFGGCAGMEIFPAVADNLIGILEGARTQIIATALVDDVSFTAALEALREWKNHPAAAQWYVVHCAEGFVPGA